MPAMHYTVRWPDASESLCYSPSLVIEDYLRPGQAYALADFMARVREATAIANQRVQAKFGFVCSRAGDQLAQLEALAQAFQPNNQSQVLVLAFSAAD